HLQRPARGEAREGEGVGRVVGLPALLAPVAARGGDGERGGGPDLLGGREEARARERARPGRARGPEGGARVGGRAGGDAPLTVRAAGGGPHAPGRRQDRGRSGRLREEVVARGRGPREKGARLRPHVPVV